ncbi:Major facilitator superfamily transporter [Mycena chlorophos]|uniref:Major facilitator superfamily transporter n=1 Tax=Mycena chlorophos TaxID=658473 RepID=A0A8H6RX69_MYCCL|nr:Major facilitator superfamily transporter [Mycena chlorophos]
MPTTNDVLEHTLEAPNPDEKETFDDGGAVATNEPQEHLEGLRLTLLMAALCLSVFLVSIDNMIITTAIPKITDAFDALDDISWYGSAYVSRLFTASRSKLFARFLLATASTQLLFGRLYSFLDQKWVFIAAITIFEIGSAVCGAAPSSHAFIAGRAIAGFGTAGVFSGAIIIIAHAAPLEKRPIYTSIIGAMDGIASVGGPLLGGLFTDKVSWRWCFYVNLSIGAATLFLLIPVLKMPRNTNAASSRISFWARIDSLDPLGTIVFIPAVVSLLLALQWGGTTYAWNESRVVALLVVFGVLTIVFVLIQLWKQDNATLPPRILKQRSIWAGAYVEFTMGAAFFIVVFFFPVWLQAIKGFSAVKSGYSTIPLILSLVFGSLVAGYAVTATGYYVPWLILGAVFMSAGAGVLYTLRVDTGHAKFIAYQVLFGLGFGFANQQPFIAVQTVLPLEDVPIGTSIIMLMQTLGGAVFLSAATNVFTDNLAQGVARISGVSPESVVSTGATNLASAIAPQYLGAVLVVYNDAIMKTFEVAIALSGASLLGSLAMEWRSVKAPES